VAHAIFNTKKPALCAGVRLQPLGHLSTRPA
jgi:hypothetical protein